MFTMQEGVTLQQTKGPFGRRGFSQQGQAASSLFIVTICLFCGTQAAQCSLESLQHRFAFGLAGAAWKVVFPSCVHKEVNRNTGVCKHK